MTTAPVSTRQLEPRVTKQEANRSLDELLSRLPPSAPQTEVVKGIVATVRPMLKHGCFNLAPLLPAFLSLKGRPYTLDHHFPFEPLFSTAMPRNIVVKAGRQVAKTVRQDSKFNKVYDKYGRRYRLDDVVPGQVVQSFDENTFQSCEKIVTQKHLNPSKTCYYVRTRRGVEMELAETHPLYAYDGWTAVSELDVGDRIAHIRHGGVFGKKKVDSCRIRVTAYMLGDGSFRGSYNFTANRNTEAIREMRELLQNFRKYRKDGTKANSLVINRDHELYNWAREDDLDGKLAHEKQIPSWVFLLSRVNTRLFISRLWATDGMVKPEKSKASISYTSTSRDLVYDLKSLLAKFAIPTSVKQRQGAYKKPNGVKVECRQYWQLRVETAEGWQTFLNEFAVPDKPGFELHGKASNNNRYTVPIEIGELIADIAGECVGKNRHSYNVTPLLSAGLRKTPKYPVGLTNMRKYLEFFRKHRPEHPRLCEFEKYVDRDCDWDEIVEIRNIGKHRCVDIEVEDTHCYLLDGVASHNSTSIAAQGVIIANCLPFFNTLFVTPLFEMIRRFSGNYVRGFIDQSPVRRLWTSTTTSSNVLQRSFTNHSNLFFSFAFQDADRTRGIDASKNVFDEVQDMDEQFIPIINETMSGSPYGGINQFTGTPKTLDNTLEGLWLGSSAAEWVMKCRKCGYRNVPALTHDLDEMIGPWHEDISEERPGIICAKCRQPKSVFPREGRWVHGRPSDQIDNEHINMMAEFPGYHVPQMIMPMHYADPDKWSVLLTKRRTLSDHVFYNEVCGESFDAGSKLVTLSDLRRAAVLHENKLEIALEEAKKYDTMKILAIDWGGGGQNPQKAGQLFISYTVYAVMTLVPDGTVHVLYGYRSKTPHDQYREARIALDLAGKFGCQYVAHDYSGAGQLREKIMVDAGFPLERIAPVWYVPTASQAAMRHVEATEIHPRAHYKVDKARTLHLTCESIRQQFIKFFKMDYRNKAEPGLLWDFLALVEDKMDSKSGRDTYRVIRSQSMTDDFAQAVNIGACTLWYMHQAWPQVAANSKFEIDPELLEQMGGLGVDWDEAVH